MNVVARILVRAAKDYKHLLIAGYLSVFGAAFFALLIPRVLGRSMDRILSRDGTGLADLLLLAGALLLAGVARGLFSFGQTFFAENLAQRVAYDIRNEFFDRLQHLSFAFHDRQKTGGLMSRATADVEGVRMFLNMGAIRIGFVVFMVVGTAIAMVLTDVRLAAISLSFVPFLILRAVVASQRLRRVWLHVQQLTADMVTVLQENLIGIRVVKAFAADEHEQEKFKTHSRRVAERTKDAELLWARNMSIMNFGFTIAIGAIIWAGGLMVVDGKQIVGGRVVYSGLTPGDLTAFLFYMGLLVMPVRMLGWIVNAYSRAASSGARLFEILDAESPVKERRDARDLGRIHGHVVFDHVSFSYDGRTPALNDVTVDVRPSQRVALLGRPGSGKTTFAHLLARFYDVTSGRIAVDGVDIRDVTLRSLRRNVGVVQQDVFIHTSSIRDNIAYGRIDAPIEAVSEAASVAQLHSFIVSLPDGYDTVVGERGVGLSGGQKQRLAIARTLILDPPVLVLDDSMSSVDVQTERAIQEALEAATANRTSFLITNRLTTIRTADLILVFKDGQVVDRGSFDDLLATSTEFQFLYDSQIRPHEETLGQQAALVGPRKMGKEES